MIQRLLIAMSLLLCQPLMGDIFLEQSDFQVLMQQAEAQGPAEAKALQEFMAERDRRLEPADCEEELAEMTIATLACKEVPADIPADYFLPDDHPAKPFLDKVFSKPNVLASTDNLKKAGFIKPVERKLRGIVVGFHPDLKGYLTKMYLDSRAVNEIEKWTRRIEGARLIQACLDKYGYNNIMKVPGKWLYRIPEDPSPKKKPEIATKKHYLLVCENMNIYSDSDIWKLYKTIVKPYHLNALYNVLVDCKLIDSTWILNIPFSYDGKIAFVDTEFAGKSLMIWQRLPNLAKYLSSEMAGYWMDLIDRGGIPPKNYKDFWDESMGDYYDDLDDYEDAA